MYRIISSTKKDILTSSFPICTFFICIIVVNLLSLGLARYAHQCNNVMGVTKHFLLGFKTHYTKMEPIPDTVIWIKNLWLDRLHVTGKNLTAIILLNMHRIKLTPNDLFYTHRLMHPSNLIREASFGSRWQLTQGPTTGQGTEAKT